MNTPLVSTTWLYEHLEDPTLAIADCRFDLMQPELGRQHYQTAHIPGAYYLDLNLDLSSPVSTHGGRHTLPDPTILAKKLETIGVDSASSGKPTRVVIYDDSRMAFAARLWWLLRYLGHAQVAVLDGGWAAWNAAGYPTTPTVPSAKAGRFIPSLQGDQAIAIDQLKARQGLATTVLIDARDGDRYRGEREPIDPIAGHIPGAVNYPWQDATDAQGFMRSPETQRQRWAALSPTDDIIVYCGSGVTACVNLLSLELAGIPAATLYPGGWSDWCSYLTSGDHPA